MLNLKRATVITLLALAATLSTLATDYSALAVKAARFYKYQEWASALAMYKMMLAMEPQDPGTYSHAIIASAKANQPDEQSALFEQSMNAGVPLDSVYDRIQTLAFEQDDPQLYEQFLRNIAKKYPWLQRNIDNRLLNYYSWRRDGSGMIEYAQLLLKGMPDDINFLTILADGYFLNGDDNLAVQTYKHIEALDPDNYHTLLILGNYYNNLSHTDRFNTEAPTLAKQYLQRANALRPTPYVTNLLKNL